MQVIDKGVPADRQIRMPPREPEHIPQPRVLREAREHRPGRVWWETLLMVLSGLAALVVGGFTLLLTIGMFISPTTKEDLAVLWGAVVIGWLLTVILALPIVLLARGRRR
jgi:zinc protease